MRIHHAWHPDRPAERNRIVCKIQSPYLVGGRVLAYRSVFGSHALCQAAYLAETACGCRPSTGFEEVCCWSSRGCKMTFTMQNPGYFETRTESSSAALNWRGTAFSVCIRARWVAFFEVSPMPFREHSPGIHVEYHPARRIIVSKTAAGLS